MGEGSARSLRSRLVYNSILENSADFHNLVYVRMSLDKMEGIQGLKLL